MNTIIVYIHYIFWVISISVIALVIRIRNRLAIMHKDAYSQFGAGASSRRKSLPLKFLLHREHAALNDKILTRLCDTCAILIAIGGILGLYIFIMTPSSGVRLDFWNASTDLNR